MKFETKTKRLAAGPSGDRLSVQLSGKLERMAGWSVLVEFASGSWRMSTLLNIDWRLWRDAIGQWPRLAFPLNGHLEFPMNWRITDAICPSSRKESASLIEPFDLVVKRVRGCLLVELTRPNYRPIDRVIGAEAELIDRLCCVNLWPILFWQGNVLQHNVSAGVIISNSSLVLQRVSRTAAGRYTCHASNAEGEGASAPFNLNVMRKFQISNKMAPCRQTHPHQSMAERTLFKLTQNGAELMDVLTPVCALFNWP